MFFKCQKSISCDIDANHIAYLLFQNTGHCIFELVLQAIDPLGGIVQHKFCAQMCEYLYKLKIRVLSQLQKQNIQILTSETRQVSGI